MIIGQHAGIRDVVVMTDPTDYMWNVVLERYGDRLNITRMTSKTGNMYFLEFSNMMDRENFLSDWRT